MKKCLVATGVLLNANGRGFISNSHRKKVAARINEQDMAITQVDGNKRPPTIMSQQVVCL